MENKVKSDCIQREFGHCVVNWNIVNYGFAAHGMKYELKSQEYAVKPHMTKWRMSLKSELGLCDDTNILFCLKRIDYDSGPDVVWVDMDVSILDQEGNIWKGFREEHFFRRNNSNFVNLPNIYYGKVNVGLYNFNVMTLRCQMIVHEEKNRWRNKDSIDFGLKCLALDMERLYTNGKFKDVTLKLENDFQTEAHKAILASRCIVLKDVFDQDALPIFSCLKLRFNETQQVLKYLYTGDMGHILDKPSIYAFDCINDFSIDELDDHYIVDEQNLKSTIHVHQTGLMWTIDDFCERDEEHLSSRIISGDLLEMAWQVRLYPRGIDGKDDYLTIIAENMEGKIDGDVWAKVEVFHDPYDRSWKTMKALKAGELFELRNLDTRDSVLKKLENGALKICFKVCVSTGETHLSVGQLVNPIPNVPYKNYYKKLSNDIFSLREDGRYADIILRAQGKELKAHKCILSVRSSKFSKLCVDPCDDTCDDTIRHIEDIRPDIIEIILDYMYSGVLKKFEWNILLEVYEAAERLGVNYLVQEYSQILRDSLNVDNVLKISMSALEHIDEPLLREALKFLSLDTSMFDKKFLILEEEKPGLRTEVEKALKKLQLNAC